MRTSLFRMTPGLLNYNCTRYKGHEIKYKPYVPPPVMDHDHKNMALKRPMSPHLTVYAPTVPSMTSVTQRATDIIRKAACGELLGSGDPTDLTPGMCLVLLSPILPQVQYFTVRFGPARGLGLEQEKEQECFSQ
ncbi:unnamed protein product [Spodoptera exigua]|nr:unnamed protein product [Spodoptera exigua]